MLVVSSLSSGDGSNDPGNGGADPVESLTFTDEHGVSNVDHTVQIRDLFRNIPTVDRYIYVMFNTAALNRVTEVCIRDGDDLFAALKLEGNHNSRWVQNSDATQSAYRLNNGEWVNSAIRLRSNKDGSFSEIELSAASNTTASAYLVDRPSSDMFDAFETRHQHGWWTMDSQSGTQVTFTVANDRFTACGY